MALAGTMPVLDVPSVIKWARGTLHALDVPEAAARIRARLDPNPTGEREALVLVDLDQGGTLAAIDSFVDELEAVLPEAEGLALGTRLRIDLLDGSGAPLLSRTRVIVSKRGGVEVSTTSSSSGPTTIDVSPEPAPPPGQWADTFQPPAQLAGQLPRTVSQAFQTGQALAGGAMVTVPLGYLQGLMMIPALQAYEFAGRVMGQNDRMFAQTGSFVDTMRRQVVATHETFGGVYERLIDAREEAIRSQGSAQLAEKEAELAQPDSPAKQAATVLQAGARLIESLQGQAAAAAAPVVGAAEAVADAAPDIGALLFDPDVPPEVIAAIIEQHPHAARLRAIAAAVR